MAPGSTALTAAERDELLRAREAVWKAWFANDQDELLRALPAETIAIDAGVEAWGDVAEILRRARSFAADGGRLVRLEFPKTEIQAFSAVAVLYTTYLLETEHRGERVTMQGRGTEVFVRRDGRWLNAGWHLDSGR
jgi:hypothetical protein